ncbi:MAG: signal peptidase I [Ruminococcus sp.]|nr:signal peptidase I [Ruminococcus sp.]
MNKILKKIMNIVIDVIIVLIMVVSVMVVVLSLTSKSSGVSNIFGIAPLSVQTDSMEDTIKVNDMIISKTTENGDVFEVGDVVTFPIREDGVEVLNTHRIVDIVEKEGMKFYKTQGDNKAVCPEADSDLQSSYTIVAKWTGTRIPGIGAFFSFIRTQLGFFLVILLPMILFFVYQAIRVIMNIIAYNKEKAAEDAAAAVANSELTEEQKQRAIAEYLAQQKLQQESEPTVQTPAEGEQSDADTD